MSPWIIGFTVFIVYPMVSSLYFSFTHYDLLGSPQWVGFANYKYMFTEDILFWKAITDACAEGRTAFDFGRSDPDQTGLLTFKDRWGAARVPVSYWRCPASRTAASPLRRWVDACASRAFFHAPDGIRVAAGTLLYKHIG